MKKLFKFLMMAVLLLFLMTALFGCVVGKNVKKTREAMSEQYVEWTDEQAGISFRKLEPESVGGFGYITLDGTKKDAFFVFNKHGMLDLAITLLDTETHLLDETEYVYLEYNDGNLVSLKEGVSLFGNDFSQIVLSKSEIDRETIDASEYVYVDWKESSSVLAFSIGADGSKLGFGTAKTDASTVEITFFWRENQSFEIYQNHITERTGTPAASGTYTSNQGLTVLTFSSDNLFEMKFPTMAIMATTKA